MEAERIYHEVTLAAGGCSGEYMSGAKETNVGPVVSAGADGLDRWADDGGPVLEVAS